MARTADCTPAIRKGRLERADEFYEAAEAVTTSSPAAYVSNLVLAGIAASDVICCARLGHHARGGAHGDAVSLLRTINRKLAEDLAVLLKLKTSAAYDAGLPPVDDVLRAFRACTRLVEAARKA